MSSAVALSPQDLEDLHQIRSMLPSADPRIAQIDSLVKAQQQQPTEFEKERQPATGSAWDRLKSGAWSALQGMIPGSVSGAAKDAGQTAVEAATATLLPHIAANAYGSYKDARESGEGMIPSIAGALGSTVGLDTPGIRQRSMHGDIAGVAGEAIPSITATLAGGELGRLKGVPDAIGSRAVRALTDPRTGELTTGFPSAIKRLQSRYEGFDIPRAREEMYNDLGDSLMRREKQQASLDKKAAPQKLPSTFTMSAEAPQRAAGIPRVGSEVPLVRFGPEPPKLEPGTFTAAKPEPQAAIPRVGNDIPSVRFGPETPAPKSQPGTFTATRPEPQAGIPRVANAVPSARFGEAPKTPAIANPSEGLGNAQPRVGNEGSAARWKTDDAMRILRDSASDVATKREAAMTLTRRGIDLPDNYRYLWGDQRFGASTYNPRDVTKFTPEGEPIRQGGKWKPIQ